MWALPIDELDLDRKLVLGRGGLYRFMRMAWPQVEAQAFIDGWHLEEVCAHLEAVSRGEIDRLIINIPPGTTKSLSVSVFWPAWDWILNSWRKFMYASFDASLSQRDALRSKDLVRSDWYQKRFGLTADPRELEKMWARGRESARGVCCPVQIVGEGGKQNTAGIFWTTGGGFRFSTSEGGKATGWHAHIQVIDDPTKPLDVQEGGNTAKNALEKTRAWYNNTMASRKADPKSFARVLIMQRLHEMDLAGQLLKEGGYVHLCFPMRFRTKPPEQGKVKHPETKVETNILNIPCKTPWGGDRRTKDGELLWPERFDEKATVTTERDMGSRVAAAQLDQTPSPEGGEIFKRAWFNNRWKSLPAGGRMIQSWDCTFKEVDTSDFVVGQVWLRRGGLFYLIREVRARMDLPTTIQAIKDLRRKFPQARTILIEDKANGPAVEQTLRKKLSGLVMWESTSGKEGRANAVAPFFEAGNVILPDDWPEIDEYVEELCGFPMRQFDDRVDATSQALLYLDAGPASRFNEAMEKV